MSPADFITSLDGPWIIGAFASDFWNMLSFTAVVFIGGVALGRFSKNGAIEKIQGRLDAEKDKADHLRTSLMVIGFSKETVERAETGAITRDDVVGIIHEEMRPISVDEIDEMFRDAMEEAKSRPRNANVTDHSDGAR